MMENIEHLRTFWSCELFEKAQALGIKKILCEYRRDPTPSEMENIRRNVILFDEELAERYLGDVMNVPQYECFMKKAIEECNERGDAFDKWLMDIRVNKTRVVWDTIEDYINAHSLGEEESSYEMIWEAFKLFEKKLASTWLRKVNVDEYEKEMSDLQQKVLGGCFPNLT